MVQIDELALWNHRALSEAEINNLIPGRALRLAGQPGRLLESGSKARAITGSATIPATVTWAHLRDGPNAKSSRPPPIRPESRRRDGLSASTE
jgi:hypothetical protein